MENVIVQGILFSSGPQITPQEVGMDTGLTVDEKRLESFDPSSYKAAKEAVLQQFNERYIGSLLSKHGGNVTQSARSCGMERQALQQIMRRYGISADDYRDKD